MINIMILKGTIKVYFCYSHTMFYAMTMSMLYYLV